MFRFVVILALLGVVLGAEIQPVPTSHWEGRIVGGHEAAEGEFPYQASLRTLANFHYCGGSLINNRWILSAAHCTIGRAPASTMAIVGTVNRVTGGTRYNIIRIINHEAYNANLISNDVSVLQTSEAMTSTFNVNFINYGSTFIGGDQPAMITGWGQTTHPGSAAVNLMSLRKNTLTNEDCRDRHTNNNAQFVFASTLCAGGTTGQGICMGDSGGPLVVDGAVHGIASWVIPCGNGWPDAYARVSYFHGWITAAISS